MSETNGFDAFDEATRDDIARLLWLPRFEISDLSTDLAAQLTSVKNSPAAAGERMRRFLAHLIDHPVTHTRNEAKAYSAALPHCASLSPLQAYALRSLLPRSASDGYEPVPENARLQFPRDHELKLRAQLGWHFFVGTCWDTEGQEYGIELMFFGVAMFPPALAAEYGLSDLENQMVEFQLAISVAGERHHQARPIVMAGTSGLIQASADPFFFRLGRNQLASQRAGELFPLHAQARGVDESETEPIELEVDLVFSSGKDYLAQGAGGAMPSVDGVGTTYYSIPRIEIEPLVSRLRVGDREVKLQKGLFWFDHQWGALGINRSEVMRAADNIGRPEPGGWDWFEAQFLGDRQLTVFAPHKLESAKDFYAQTGPVQPANMEVRVGGKFMNAASETRTVWGTLRVTEWIKAQRSPCPERYPPTGVWHPNRWEFDFADLPADIRSFTMTPIVDSGQSAFFATGAQISEGAVRLHDRAGRDIGRGFAESVGYADPRTCRNSLRLAGLPESDALLELLERKPPPLGTRIMNALYVLSHRTQLRETLARAKGIEFFDGGDVKPSVL